MVRANEFPILIEFFRFVPNEIPKFRLFPWSNFTIDVSCLKQLITLIILMRENMVV